MGWFSKQCLAWPDRSCQVKYGIILASTDRKRERMTCSLCPAWPRKVSRDKSERDYRHPSPQLAGTSPDRRAGQKHSLLSTLCRAGARLHDSKVIRFSRLRGPGRDINDRQTSKARYISRYRRKKESKKDHKSASIMRVFPGVMLNRPQQETYHHKTPGPRSTD